MGTVSRLAAAVLALALVLTGCGPQQPDDQQDDEEVYIFPDGTEVRGEAATWVREVERVVGGIRITRWKPTELPPVLDALPIPEEFRLVNVWTNGGTLPDYLAIWAEPASQEVISVTALGQKTPVMSWLDNCVTEAEDGTPLADLAAWYQQRCGRVYVYQGHQLHIVAISSDADRAMHLVKVLGSGLVRQ